MIDVQCAPRRLASAVWPRMVGSLARQSRVKPLAAAVEWTLTSGHVQFGTLASNAAHNKDVEVGIVIVNEPAHCVAS